MSTNGNGNGTSRFVRFQMTVSTSLLVLAVAAGIGTYGEVRSIRSAVDALEGRVERIEATLDRMTQK